MYVDIENAGGGVLEAIERLIGEMRTSHEQ